ncbi:MAG: DegT/DnrJ/EryC1/StrS family aminotransferase [Gammaproteobacteria bacterium]|nr:DegT/DnrJ/EryC1/StrS family aminotransferase [Gammaproteobacteria bacterium]
MILCANPKEQYLSHKDEIKLAIDKVLESGWYILGQEVKAFEKEFANFVGVKYSIGVASGTDAIFLSLKALDIGTGDEVITVSHTATATVSAIEATGAKAIFVDVEEEYFTMDVSKIEEVITDKTKAIIPVHIYGHPCDMNKLQKISKENNLYLIEDCAQASGAKYEDKDVGSMGDLGCFSFFPTKNLGALGDGGAITTNSKELYEKLLMLRQYGWDKNRESKFQGYNSRLDEIQAAVLRVKLKYLKQDIEKRNKVASLYYKYLKDTDFILPKVKDSCYHAYHLFVIKTDNRDKVLKFLEENNIMAMIHYDKAVHMNEAYKIYSNLSITEKIINNILSLPLYPELKNEDIKQISNLCINYKSLKE